MSLTCRTRLERISIIGIEDASAGGDRLDTEQSTAFERLLRASPAIAEAHDQNRLTVGSFTQLCEAEGIEISPKSGAVLVVFQPWLARRHRLAPSPIISAPLVPGHALALPACPHGLAPSTLISAITRPFIFLA